MKQAPTETWESTRLEESLNNPLMDLIVVLRPGGQFKSESRVCYKVWTDGSEVVNMVVEKVSQQAPDLNV